MRRQVALYLPFDRNLQAGNRHGWEAATRLLSTDVIGVGAAVPSRLQVDEGTDAFERAAAAAEDRPFEEVVVHPLPRAPLSARGHHRLDSLEELHRNEGRVASFEDLAFVRDNARVVRISEHLGQRADREGLLRPRACGSSGEATRFEFVTEAGEGVVARGVRLERPLHERCPLWVDVDRVHEVAVDRLANVEVPELRPTGSAALLRLVRHLVGDVATVVSDLDVVEAIGEHLEEQRHVLVGAEVLGRADQLDTQIAQVVLDQHRVVQVAERSRPGVDDYGVDVVGVLLDVREHLTKDSAFGDGLRAGAGLDKFLNDLRADLTRFAPDEVALGRDRVAVRLNIPRRAQLPLATHTEVHEGTLD